MRYFLILSLFAIVCLFGLAGCSLDDALARAQQTVTSAQTAVDKASATLAKSDAAIADAHAAIAVAQQIADTSKNATAQDAVAKASTALAMAEAARPTLVQTLADAKEALTISQQGVTAAQAAKAAGGSTWDVLIALVSTLLPAAGVIAKLARDASQARTAIAVVANHADRMEAAQTDADVTAAKTQSQAEQVAHGVADLIAVVRSKAA